MTTRETALAAALRRAGEALVEAARLLEGEAEPERPRRPPRKPGTPRGHAAARRALRKAGVEP